MWPASEAGGLCEITPVLPRFFNKMTQHHFSTQTHTNKSVPVSTNWFLTNWLDMWAVLNGTRVRHFWHDHIHEGCGVYPVMTKATLSCSRPLQRRKIGRPRRTVANVGRKLSMGRPQGVQESSRRTLLVNSKQVLIFCTWFHIIIVFCTFIIILKIFKQISACSVRS